MGQYHKVVNYDKRQFLHPHKFDDGVKLMEFGRGGDSTMLALAVLLAASNKGGARGGGDLHPWTEPAQLGYEGRTTPANPDRAQWLMDNVVGSWAGDRIAIIGDYAEGSDAGGLVEREGTPWKPDRGNKWIDVSDLALEAMELDYYVYIDRRKRVA